MMPPSSALEGKLAEAQFSRSKKRRKIAGYGAVVVVAALLLVTLAYLSIQLDRARTQLQQIGQSAGQLSLQPPPLDAGVGGITAPPPNQALESSQSVQSTRASEPPPSPESPATADAGASGEQLSITAPPPNQALESSQSVESTRASEPPPSPESPTTADVGASGEQLSVTAPPPNQALESSQAIESTRASEAPPSPESPATADAGGFREQFLQRLEAYESEVESQVGAIHLRDWDADGYARLANLKTRAIEQFSAGDYLLARQSLQQARELAAAAAANHAKELTAARRAAAEAFANGRAAEAQRAVRRALLMNPSDPDMSALEARVAVLPEVLDLLRQAKVAQNENRPAKEAAALQKIVALDGTRASVKARLQAVREQLLRQRFADAIGAAQDALAAGDLPAAEKQIQLAKAVWPAHEALKPLQQRLQQVRTEREFEAQMALGEQAGRRDDWQAATAHFARARQLKPNHQGAVAGQNRARQVLEVEREITRILAREHRLADRRVVDSAAAYLRETETVTRVSPRLRELHTELAGKVDLYLTEVEVVVLSDNATHIIVRGEGQVGKTERRTIRLRPGKRVFEGSRRGYKSKLVTLDIAPGATSVEVAVICDEKI